MMSFDSASDGVGPSSENDDSAATRSCGPAPRAAPLPAPEADQLRRGAVVDGEVVPGVRAAPGAGDDGEAAAPAHGERVDDGVAGAARRDALPRPVPFLVGDPHRRAGRV